MKKNHVYIIWFLYCFVIIVFSEIKSLKFLLDSGCGLINFDKTLDLLILILPILYVLKKLEKED